MAESTWFQMFGRRKIIEIKDRMLRISDSTNDLAVKKNSYAERWKTNMKGAALANKLSNSVLRHMKSA